MAIRTQENCKQFALPWGMVDSRDYARILFNDRGSTAPHQAGPQSTENQQICLPATPTLNPETTCVELLHKSMYDPQPEALWPVMG